MADADARLCATRRVRELDRADPAAFRLTELVASGEPAIIRGAARDWPLVGAGLTGDDALAAMLRGADAGLPVTAYVGEPRIHGRFHYSDDGRGMNFVSERGTVGAFVDRMLAARDDEDAPATYLGSVDLDRHFPRLAATNAFTPGDGTFADHPPLASIWIGGRSVAATHWDMSNNIAICVAGHRRFTLFPPEQVANLYPGPVEPTPAGQVVSMVDVAAPDLARYPRFVDAIAHARVAELEPGDALVYPALWWHNVEALDPFNVLVNFWWNAAPAFADDPMTTLLHAMLSLRERPAHEKEAWRHMFDWYVFGPGGQSVAHLPDAARGPLAPLDEVGARRLRALVANRLKR